MKARYVLAGIAVAAALSCAMGGCKSAVVAHPYVQEYAAGRGNIQGDVDVGSFTAIDSAFDIGATAEGYAVFKNPSAAFAALKEKFGDGLALIQREFGLGSLSPWNYGTYKLYGWQVAGGTDGEKEQARFVSGFMDIYENSFES